MRSLALAFLLAIAFCVATGSWISFASGEQETAVRLAAEVDDQATPPDRRRAALAKLQEAVRLFLSIEDKLPAARVLLRVGRLQLRLNQPDASRESYQQALALNETVNDPLIEIDGQNGLGSAYLAQQKMEPAEAALQRSLALNPAPGYVLGRAQALLTLSDLQNYRDHSLGLRTAREALPLWQALNDRAGQARTFSQIGQCLMALSELAESIENYQQSLQIWRELNDPSEQAGVLIMLGFIEERQGESDNSINRMTEAQRLLEGNDDPVRLGQISAGLAEAFNDNGLPEIGLTHYQRALYQYQRTGDPHLVWYAHWGIGITYFLRSDLTNAIDSFQQSLIGQNPNGIETAQTNQYLGRIYGVQGQNDQALGLLRAARATFARIGNPREGAQSQALIAQILERQGAIAQARTDFQQALDSFVRIADRPNEAATRFALGRLELVAGNLDAAEPNLRRSIEITEEIRRRTSGTDLTAAFSATVHERYERYISCLMQLGQKRSQPDLIIRAFETSERLRARSLADWLMATRTDLNTGLDPALAIREKSLRQSLKAKEDYKTRLLAHSYSNDELTAVEQELGALNSEYKKVLADIGVRFPGYRQITRPVTWELKQVQDQVLPDDQTVLLEYCLGTDKSYAWIVTRNGFSSYELPREQDIIAAANRVYGLVSTAENTSRGGEFDAAAKELSRMVLAPMAAELNRKRIIVVADGILNYIPFQALSGDGKDPLITRSVVVNAPSATILGELRADASGRTPRPRLIAAFGNPIFADAETAKRSTANPDQIAALNQSDTQQLSNAVRDVELVSDGADTSNIPRLFYSQRELIALRELSPGGNDLIAQEYDATRDQLLQADLTQFAVLHFATHGFLNSKRPENSGLLLSTVNRQGAVINGFVQMKDIYQLRAPVDLVVLSACRTALGKDVRGEGLLGITRGFMYAGASGVVASLWQVNDEATEQLMRDFYANMLQKGMPPADALREAQNTLRKKPEWSAPYYWAGFIIQGESGHVIRSTVQTGGPSRKLVGGVVIGLVAIAGFGLLYRRRRAHSAA